MSVDSIVRTDLVDVPICILSIGIHMCIFCTKNELSQLGINIILCLHILQYTSSNKYSHFRCLQTE